MQSLNSTFLMLVPKESGRREDLQVTSLFFVDGTLVFHEDSQDQMMYLSCMFMQFEALSWLKINLENSVILLVGRVKNVECLAQNPGRKG